MTTKIRDRKPLLAQVRSILEGGKCLLFNSGLLLLRGHVIVRAVTRSLIAFSITRSMTAIWWSLTRHQNRESNEFRGEVRAG